MGLCVFSLPISLKKIVTIWLLYLTIVIESEVLPISHCFRLGLYSYQWRSHIHVSHLSKSNEIYSWGDRFPFAIYHCDCLRERPSRWVMLSHCQNLMSIFFHGIGSDLNQLLSFKIHMKKPTRLKSGWGFGQTNSPLSTARVLIDAVGLCLLRVSEVCRLFAPDLRRWINSFSGSDFKPRLDHKTWYFCYFFTNYDQQF